MTQEWIVNIWGVRGSMPAAYPENMGYGGNTSCVSVDCGEDLVVFDAGSGLSMLGARLTGNQPIHLFISHVHIDHLLGLYVFPPFHDPNREIHIYGEARGGVALRKQLETVIGPPYWPIGFDDFRARIVIHETGPDQEIPLPHGRTVRTMRANHPNQCLLYRLQSPQRSIAYALDCELTDELRPRMLEFCRGAGLVIWDASFNHADLALHPGWGHSSWEQGVQLRRDAGAGRMLMSHFSQNYTDTFLQEQERLVMDPDVQFAREGMEVHI